MNLLCNTHSLSLMYAFIYKPCIIIHFIYNFTMKIFFVDFEGFQHGRGAYKPVEMCVMEVNESYEVRPLLMTFAQSEPWDSLTEAEQTTYNYQLTNLHKLPWKFDEKGEKLFDPVKVKSIIDRVFQPKSNEVFTVFGRQKLNFLRKTFPMYTWKHYSMISSFRETHGFVDSKNNSSSPFVHVKFHDKRHCALLKCYKLACHWYAPHTKPEMPASTILVSGGTPIYKIGSYPRDTIYSRNRIGYKHNIYPRNRIGYDTKKKPRGSQSEQDRQWCSCCCCCCCGGVEQPPPSPSAPPSTPKWKGQDTVDDDGGGYGGGASFSAPPSLPKGTGGGGGEPSSDNNKDEYEFPWSCSHTGMCENSTQTEPIPTKTSENGRISMRNRKCRRHM